MYIKLDYFYFPAFSLEVKATEISKYILPSFEEKYGQGWGVNHQILSKYYSQK